MLPRIIHIEPSAPPKPAPGEPCNGCGVCCLVEPCPLGRILSRRRYGACAALRWEGGRYSCGALTAPAEVLHAAWPSRWLRPFVLPLLRRLARRWIAAGQGCDCSLQVDRSVQTDRQSGP